MCVCVNEGNEEGAEGRGRSSPPGRPSVFSVAAAAQRLQLSRVRKCHLGFCYRLLPVYSSRNKEFDDGVDGLGLVVRPKAISRSSILSSPLTSIAACIVVRLPHAVRAMPYISSSLSRPVHMS